MACGCRQRKRHRHHQRQLQRVNRVRRTAHTSNGDHGLRLARRQAALQRLVGRLLVLMGVRLYYPATGRFLQVDPIPGGSANAYDYVSQEPATHYDLGGSIEAIEEAGDYYVSLEESLHPYEHQVEEVNDGWDHTAEAWVHKSSWIVRYEYRVTQYEYHSPYTIITTGHISGTGIGRTKDRPRSQECEMQVSASVYGPL